VSDSFSERLYDEHGWKLDFGPFAPFLYKYHPVFLFFVLPLASLPRPEAVAIWRMASIVCLLISLWLIIRGQPRSLRLPLVALGMLLLTNLSPLTLSVRLGQVDPLLLLGIVAALSLMAGGKRWLSVPLWGLLGLIKVYPLFLLLPDLLRGRLRYLAAIAATLPLWVGTSILTFGLTNERDFWQIIVPALDARTARLTNQSLYAVAARLVRLDTARGSNDAMEVPLADAVYLLVSLVIVVLVVVVLWQSRFQLDQHPWEVGSLMICTTLLLLPVCWDHYQTLLLLPLLVAGTLILDHGQDRDIILLLGAYALLAFGTYKHVQVGLLPSYLVLFFASYRTFGLCLLWLWWLRWFRAVRITRGSMNIAATRRKVA
jgi:hypothetical protein